VESSAEAAFVVHGSLLLTLLCALFEAEWERATPLAAPVPGQPDEEGRRLLTLMASGLTDAAIARSLGWSLRTTQRRIQKVIHGLGATTRFQAGMAAKQRGWLLSPGADAVLQD
jgi:DNA-binding NarL/FixJ family response regulator